MCWVALPGGRRFSSSGTEDQNLNSCASRPPNSLLAVLETSLARFREAQSLQCASCSEVPPTPGSRTGHHASTLRTLSPPKVFRAVMIL